MEGEGSDSASDRSGSASGRRILAVKLSDFHVDVPQELIARFPLATRDACRLQVVEPGTTARFRAAELIAVSQPTDEEIREMQRQRRQQERQRQQQGR